MSELTTSLFNTTNAVFSYSLFGLTLDKYMEALLILLIAYFALFLGKKFILNKFSLLAAKTKTSWDDKIVELFGEISNFFLFLLAIYFTLTTKLGMGGSLIAFLYGIIIIFGVFELIKIVGKIVHVAFEQTSKKDETTINAIILIIKIILWSLGILLILSNLGFDISTLIASMGIGGIAIALAAQNILSDLFASFTIFFDKPFKIGDFVVLGTDKGHIKKIGLKSTRITTLHGEELIVSNKELTSVRIQNFKSMRRRRIEFALGLVYGTSVAKLKKAKEIIQATIEAQEGATFTRCHFVSFGDFSLNYNTIYEVKSGDINEYLDIQEGINLTIAEEFEKAKIDMAFPTQTIHIQK